jgi:beta-xylosidase
VLARGDGTYVLYYTANLCIGRATAKTPLGPFVDPFPKPLVCQTAEAGSIDPSPFRDADGSLYLVWKNDGNSAGLPTHIWAQRLTSDGLHLVGRRVTLVTDAQPWEASIVEGPALWRHDGRIYLFFSGNGYATSGYAVGYATCKGPLGPCRQAPENPILKSA